ncbi:hypothetical protein [Paenibacillus hamazuiensis]|uniref:hypothetical protein n=1 Tax=Paenibacillus hamazuiensis TaxID=2936508 RepID=UPI00200C318D|nr:hypothetical protein [Paenibacillus hamazuiensis]
MPGKAKRMMEKEAAKWTGHPVLVVHQDGTCYAGYLNEVKNGEIVLSSAYRSDRKLPASSNKRQKARGMQAQVSGLLGGLLGGLGGLGGGLGGAFGGGGAARGVGAPAAGAAAGGGGGFWQKLWPGIKLGIGALQFIMPLIGKFAF